MSEDWLIETLMDLRAYAQQQRLMALAAHLDQAIALAHLEIASINAPSSSCATDESQT